MFKELGAMMSLMNNKSKIQEEMGKFQAMVGSLQSEAQSGGGLVTVKVNGRLEVLSIKISEDAMKLNDREMIEDLIVAATNQALNKVREQLAVETQKMAQNIGLPASMLSSLGGGFPGIS